MKLISLNIEGDRHLPRIIPFLQKENPDVFCLQEVYESDIDTINKNLKSEVIFVPTIRKDMAHNRRYREKGDFGTALFTRTKIAKWHAEYYYRNNSTDGQFPHYAPDHGNIGDKAVLIGEINYSGKTYKVITTHFTWSEKGVVTERQRIDMKRLFQLLDNEREFIFCGDLNTPRGSELWTELSRKYTDNIPASVTTTVDNNLHVTGSRIGGIYLVVDGLFTTPSYRAHDVRVVNGVSDHCAIVGEIDII